MCLVRPDVHASNACLGVAGWGFSSAGKSEMPRVVDKRQSHAGALLVLACSPPAPLLHKGTTSSNSTQQTQVALVLSVVHTVFWGKFLSVQLNAALGAAAGVVAHHNSPQELPSSEN